MVFDREKKAREILDSRAEWHSCGNKHGVIRNVRKSELSEIGSAIAYFMGPRSGWLKQNPQYGTIDIEFCYNIGHREFYPWSWCGETILFADWKKDHEQYRNKLSEFHIGDEVSFVYRGEAYTGIVSNINKRLTIVIPGQEMKFYMPANQVVKGKILPKTSSDLSWLQEL